MMELVKHSLNSRRYAFIYIAILLEHHGYRLYGFMGLRSKKLDWMGEWMEWSEYPLGTDSRGRTAVLFYFVQITSPQIGQLVQLFSDVKIQDLKVSLELKILFIQWDPSDINFADRGPTK